VGIAASNPPIRTFQLLTTPVDRLPENYRRELSASHGETTTG
jgi:hypothetical protein